MKYYFLLILLIVTPCKAQQMPEKESIKPTIVIGSNWSINEMHIDKATEANFEKSNLLQNLERTIHQSFTSETDKYELMYINDLENIFYIFKVQDGEIDKSEDNTLKVFYIKDFNSINISFENGLKANSSIDDVVKVIGKNNIEDFENRYSMLTSNRSDNLTIKNDMYDITLGFRNGLLSSIHVKSKKNPPL